MFSFSSGQILESDYVRRSLTECPFSVFWRAAVCELVRQRGNWLPSNRAASLWETWDTQQSSGNLWLRGKIQSWEFTMPFLVTWCLLVQPSKCVCVCVCVCVFMHECLPTYMSLCIFRCVWKGLSQTKTYVCRFPHLRVHAPSLERLLLQTYLTFLCRLGVVGVGTSLAFWGDQFSKRSDFWCTLRWCMGPTICPQKKCTSPHLSAMCAPAPS